MFHFVVATTFAGEFLQPKVDHYEAHERRFFDYCPHHHPAPPRPPGTTPAPPRPRKRDPGVPNALPGSLMFVATLGGRNALRALSTIFLLKYKKAEPKKLYVF